MVLRGNEATNLAGDPWDVIVIKLIFQSSNEFLSVRAGSVGSEMRRICAIDASKPWEVRKIYARFLKLDPLWLFVIELPPLSRRVVLKEWAFHSSLVLQNDPPRKRREFILCIA